MSKRNKHIDCLHFVNRCPLPRPLAYVRYLLFLMLVVFILWFVAWCLHYRQFFTSSAAVEDVLSIAQFFYFVNSPPPSRSRFCCHCAQCFSCWADTLYLKHWKNIFLLFFYLCFAIKRRGNRRSHDCQL